MTVRAPDGTREPTTVLILSADIGEGHNATGRALEEVVRRRWPDAAVRWLDTLDVMGPGVGPAFRAIYVENVQTTPWLYEFFYSSLWRARWFATAAKGFVSGWCGRRLRKHIREIRPDLILSTYPLGSGGLDWLRKHDGLDVPVGAWISDFSPHPFWVYETMDMHFVMHSSAVAPALRCVPSARVAVSAPPVVSAFAPGDRAAARKSFGLPEDRFIAMVSCGSFGFGDVDDAVRELLEASGNVLPVVVCGRNEELRKRVAAIDPDRVLALGWTDDMPTLTVASDIVVTNAGGATSLEALACGRPVIMYRPIAAHGRANAALMAESGLAEVTQRAELTPMVRRLLDEPETLATMEKRATEHASSRTISDDIDELLAVAARSTARAPEPLRAADAMFMHIQTPTVPQQVGAVLMFDPKPDGTSVTRKDVAYLLQAAPRADGRLDPGSAWRRPTWWQDPDVDMADAITEVTSTDLTASMDAFFSVPVGVDRPCVGRLVHGLPGGQSALMFKLHHSLGDGMVVIWSLVARARGERFILPDVAGEPARSARERAIHALHDARLALGGLARLARGGRAPRSPFDGRVASPLRHHAVANFPSAAIAKAARSVGVHRTEFLLAVLAEALHGTVPAGESVRAIVTHSTRDSRTLRLAGNYTGAASVDLPTGGMPFAERAARSRDQLRSQLSSGAPQTSELVLYLIGLVPPWLHARLARMIYGATWFNVITSLLPGEQRQVRLDGALVTDVYPVLALAPGVGVSVGMMTWGGRVTLCVSTSEELATTADELMTAVHTIVDGCAAQAAR